MILAYGCAQGLKERTVAAKNLAYRVERLSGRVSRMFLLRGGTCACACEC